MKMKWMKIATPSDRFTAHSTSEKSSVRKGTVHLSRLLAANMITKLTTIDMKYPNRLVPDGPLFTDIRSSSE
jgi:hypothetical protein